MGTRDDYDDADDVDLDYDLSDYEESAVDFDSLNDALRDAGFVVLDHKPTKGEKGIEYGFDRSGDLLVVQGFAMYFKDRDTGERGGSRLERAIIRDLRRDVVGDRTRQTRIDK